MRPGSILDRTGERAILVRDRQAPFFTTPNPNARTEDSMKDYARLHVSPSALRGMTAAQHASLIELTKPGSWDTAQSATVSLDFETIFFLPLDANGATMIHIGIEPDGYTHS